MPDLLCPHSSLVPSLFHPSLPVPNKTAESSFVPRSIWASLTRKINTSDSHAFSATHSKNTPPSKLSQKPSLLPPLSLSPEKKSPPSLPSSSSFSLSLYPQTPHTLPAFLPTLNKHTTPQKNKLSADIFTFPSSSVFPLSFLMYTFRKWAQCKTQKPTHTSFISCSFHLGKKHLTHGMSSVTFVIIIYGI